MLVFPEEDFPEIMAKPSSAIAFTGGGTRAMVAAFGQLAALHQLGLLRNVRYISGISGGSWATNVFSFYARGAPGVARSDDEFLGTITDPAALSLASLSVISPSSARAVATTPGNASGRAGAGGDGLDQLVRDLVVEEVWRFTLGKVGVPMQAAFSWSSQTVADICRRNPWLHAEDFVLPSGSAAEHPFPIVGTALIGPLRLAPFRRDSRAVQYQVLSFCYGNPRSRGKRGHYWRVLSHAVAECLRGACWHIP